MPNELIESTLRVAQRLRRRMGVAIVLTGALAVLTAGCGWIFSKQDKPLRVDVVFTGGDSLNFDGRTMQSVQVKACVLKKTERFQSADPRAIFDPGYDAEFTADFEKDVMGSVTAIVPPGETLTKSIEIDHIRARDEKKLYLAVIANFSRMPTERGKERALFPIQKKSSQKQCIDLDKNVLVHDKKCKK